MEWGGTVGKLREAAWRKALSREEIEGDVKWDMSGSETVQGEGTWEGWSKGERYIHCNPKGRFHTKRAATWALTTRCRSHLQDAAGLYWRPLHRIWCHSDNKTAARESSCLPAPAQTYFSHGSQLASSQERRHSSYKTVTTIGIPGPLFLTVSARRGC